MIDTPAARRAAAKAGLPIHVAFALLQMESNGDNIFGSDKGGMFKGLPVTKERYDQMVEAVHNGKPSNGVGPTQITWHGFFPDAAKKGFRLWEAESNMEYGFTLLASYKHLGWELAGTRYNGKASYGKTFARRVAEWEAKLGEEPAVGKVTWRGHTFDQQTKDMLVELDKLVGPNITIHPSQGSYSSGVAASGGTHSGGGAVDLSVGSAGLTPFQIDLVVFLARRVGFAAWHRVASEGPWAEHIHMINKTAKDLSPQARGQVTAYQAGLSGLASHKPDRHKALQAPSTASWASYQANWVKR